MTNLKTTQFKEMKFRVRDEEHSKQIQDYLFSLGYSWQTIDNIPYRYLSTSYLYARSSGGIGWSEEGSDIFFEDHPAQEYKLIPHNTFTIEPVPRREEVVELNGQTYLKADLEEALAKLKPIK